MQCNECKVMNAILWMQNNEFNAIMNVLLMLSIAIAAGRNLAIYEVLFVKWTNIHEFRLFDSLSICIPW